MTTNTPALEALKLLEDAEKARKDFVAKRYAMNAAIPAIDATPAERALYDERYKADHEAGREEFRAALKFVQIAADIGLADIIRAALQPASGEVEHLKKLVVKHSKTVVEQAHLIDDLEANIKLLNAKSHPAPDEKPVAYLNVIKKDGGVSSVTFNRADEAPDSIIESIPLAKQKPQSDVVKALRRALEWIDAVPDDVVLPAMPGFDRDWVDETLRTAGGE